MPHLFCATRISNGLVACLIMLSKNIYLPNSLLSSSMKLVIGILHKKKNAKNFSVEILVSYFYKYAI